MWPQTCDLMANWCTSYTFTWYVVVLSISVSLSFCNNCFICTSTSSNTKLYYHLSTCIAIISIITFRQRTGAINLQPTWLNYNQTLSKTLCRLVVLLIKSLFLLIVCYQQWDLPFPATKRSESRARTENLYLDRLLYCGWMNGVCRLATFVW